MPWGRWREHQSIRLVGQGRRNAPRQPPPKPYNTSLPLHRVLGQTMQDDLQNTKGHCTTTLPKANVTFLARHCLCAWELPFAETGPSTWVLQEGILKVNLQSFAQGKKPSPVMSLIQAASKSHSGGCGRAGGEALPNCLGH